MLLVIEAGLVACKAIILPSVLSLWLLDFCFVYSLGWVLGHTRWCQVLLLAVFIIPVCALGKLRTEPGLAACKAKCCTITLAPKLF